MSRFSQLALGTAAIKSVEFPRINVPYGVQRDSAEQKLARERDGTAEAKPVMVGLRALLPEEDDEVDRLAELYSKSKGVEKYDDVHPICVKARMVYTLALACVDPESDPCRPLPFFCDEPYVADNDTIEKRAAMIRGPGMTPDIIVFLHEHWLVWQDQINPQALTVADSELAELARKAAESGDFLLTLRPGLRLRLLHFMAALAVVALEVSGMSGGLTTSLTSNPSPKPVRKPKTGNGNDGPLLDLAHHLGGLPRREIRNARKPKTVRRKATKKPARKTR
jgi:hypothetical protein